MSKSSTLLLISSEQLPEALYQGHIFSGDGKTLAYFDKDYQLWITEINPESRTSRSHKTDIRLDAPDKDSNVRFKSFDHQGNYICILTKEKTLACFNLSNEKELIRVQKSIGSALTPFGNLLIQISYIHAQDVTHLKAIDLEDGDTDLWNFRTAEFPINAVKYSEEELQQKFEIEQKKRGLPKPGAKPSAEELAKKTLIGKESSMLYALRLKLETRRQEKTLQNTPEDHTEATLTKESLQENVYLDNPDSLHFNRINNKTFEMFIGCYGFVWRTIVMLDENQLITIKPNTGQFYSKDLVYDPVEMLPSPSNEFTFAKHGYGCSVAAISTKTESSWSFPSHEVLTKSGYGSVFGIVGGMNSRKCIVSTKEGDFFWIPGETPVPLKGLDGKVLAIYDDAVLSISNSKDKLNWYSFASN